MPKLHFLSLLQKLKYLAIPPFFLSGHLHLFHQFSDYIAVLPAPVFRHVVFPVFPLSLSFLLSFSRVFLQVLSLLFLFPDQPHLLPVLLLLCYHIHLLYKCPLLTNPDYIGDSQSFSQNRSFITVTAILYFTRFQSFLVDWLKACQYLFPQHQPFLLSLAWICHNRKQALPTNALI